MGKPIIKIGEFYLEWGTIGDAPVTYGMSLSEFRRYYWDEYGAHGMRELPARLERVDHKGTSSFTDPDVDATITANRAGPNETYLTKDQIYQAYCLREPIDGWLP